MAAKKSHMFRGFSRFPMSGEEEKWQKSKAWHIAQAWVSMREEAFSLINGAWSENYPKREDAAAKATPIRNAGFPKQAPPVFFCTGTCQIFDFLP